MKRREVWRKFPAERNQGVVQMTLTTDDIKHDLAHLEEIASISGRPLLHNVVQALKTNHTFIDVRSNGLSAVESADSRLRTGSYK